MHEILKDKSVIFFDVGYTLDRPASGDWMFTNLFYELAGDRLRERPIGELEAAWNAGLDWLAKNHLIRTEEEEAACFLRYYRIVSERLRLELTEAQLDALARDRTYNMANYIPYPDAHEVLDALSRTHRLGVISDTWPSIGTQLRTMDLERFFSFFTYSFALGVFKPDPRMYRDALARCGRPASETVFIDDGPANLAGAAACGITPVLIAANPASDVDTPFTKIRSLSELL